MDGNNKKIRDAVESLVKNDKDQQAVESLNNLIKRRKKDNLDLSAANITPSVACIIAKSLDGNENIKTLSINYNHIGYEGAKDLAKNRTLTTLDIHNNDIGPEGAKALAKNTTLTTLYIGGNEIGDDALQLIEKMLLRNNRLVRKNIDATFVDKCCFGSDLGIKIQEYIGYAVKKHSSQVIYETKISNKERTLG